MPLTRRLYYQISAVPAESLSCLTNDPLSLAHARTPFPRMAPVVFSESVGRWGIWKPEPRLVPQVEGHQLTAGLGSGMQLIRCEPQIRLVIPARSPP